MKLEYPLNDVLPSIEHARDRLLARLFHFRRDKDASYMTTDEDYALPYSFGEWKIYGTFPKMITLTDHDYDRDILVLVTGHLSNEIVEIMAEIGRLFGMLNDDVVKLV